VRAFFGGGRFHQENQKGEHHGNYSENQERVEIGKSRGLLFAKILKRLMPLRGRVPLLLGDPGSSRW
jgi:hypothetical protein